MYACTEAKETSHSRRCCPTLYIDIDVDIIYVYMYDLNMYVIYRGKESLFAFSSCVRCGVEHYA
jgi:hypothetical protein